MQARYIIFQVLALFLLVFIRKNIRFERDCNNPEKERTTSSATASGITEGLSPAPREQSDLSNHP